MSEASQFLIYTVPDGAVKVDVCIKDETVWLTQKALAELFGIQVPGINKHLKNIFESGELAEAEVISILETTTPHGAIKDRTQSQKTRFYNLDASFLELSNYPIPTVRLFRTTAAALPGTANSGLYPQISYFPP